MNEVHVWPAGEDEEHWLEGTRCACNPMQTDEPNPLILHQPLTPGVGPLVVLVK